MKEETGEAKIYTVGGEKLPEPIVYTYTWQSYETFAELQAANDLLTNDEQVKARNTDRNNNARTKAGVAELKARGIEKPTIENSSQVRLREMVKILMFSGKYTEAEAREVAATNLGLSWESDQQVS